MQPVYMCEVDFTVNKENGIWCNVALPNSVCVIVIISTIDNYIKDVCKSFIITFALSPDIDIKRKGN